MSHEEPLAGQERQSTCCICGLIFAARHSYGLCPGCCSKDHLREYDRVVSAIAAAERRNIPATLTLLEWLSALSDFKGLCAFCNDRTYLRIEMVAPDDGLTYANVVPCCQSCHVRRDEGYETAEKRVRQYLSIPRILQSEEESA